MATATLVSDDLRVRNAVMRQLEWDPEVDASEIGVAARNGAVTLTGYISSYGGKLAAERCAKRVRGVRAVANDIAVRLKLPRTDADIAGDAAFALNLRESVPRSVKAAVHSGHITLTGAVDWMFQKTQAENLVRHIPGVVGVMNHIEVVPKLGVHDIQKRIVHALHRSADVNAKQVEVKVDGDVVTLSGTVGSWLQREAAERAAGSAPGIRHVDNRITIVPTFALDEVPDDQC
jgi:osmotically-inducible protein OsmY